MDAKLYNQAGDQIGVIQLSEYVFGIDPNRTVMHQAMIRQLANARLGTHNTRGRSEVRGSTRKLYRQKGTGRARQGSIRAPHRHKGGIAHGPHPRSYEKKMPRKMRRLAVRSALSAKQAIGQIRFLDDLDFDYPRTKDMIAMLDMQNLDGKTLVVLESKRENVYRSSRNLPNVKMLLANYVNVVDLLSYDNVIMSAEAVQLVEGFLGDGTSSSIEVYPEEQWVRAAPLVADDDEDEDEDDLEEYDEDEDDLEEYDEDEDDLEEYDEDEDDEVDDRSSSDAAKKKRPDATGAGEEA